MSTSPDPRWDAVAEFPSGLSYRARARLVYWNRSFPACRAKGPHSAQCLLNIGHPGDHYGNGFDDYGPRGATTWKQGK